MRCRLLLAAAAAVACAGCGSSHHPRAAGPHRGAASWLGLDYNSRPGVGTLSEFVAHGIVYDREGNIEPPAGARAVAGTKLARGLQVSFGAGMVPDIEVDPPAALEAACPVARGCLPTGAQAIETYVEGFVATAQSVLREFPRRRVLFEPINEPWNLGVPTSQPGYQTAKTYAALLARLLPAIAHARDPEIALSQVYVPATGTLPDGTGWLPDLYRAQPCLTPGARTCGPIGGWNVHVYGLPGPRDAGIESLPALRRAMASGDDNIVVSELGFCALDVLRGDSCHENTSVVDGSSQQTAAWLGQSLKEADAMHHAGWLKALLVWARRSGGWSMQLPGGALTAQGRALESFADSIGS